MNKWTMMITYEYEGTGSFMVYNFATEDECIEKAKTCWQEFYKNRASKKSFSCSYQNKEGTTKNKVLCDSVGHCTIKKQ